MAMTLQEIYTKVRTHLLTQNKRSEQFDPLAGRVMCRYRASDNLMCAVGFLITEAAYKPMLEGRGVKGKQVRDALLLSGVLPEPPQDFKMNVFEEPARNQVGHINLLHELQTLHDSVDVDVENWPEHLDRLADDFNLIVEA